jgi:hypothetical protein
MKKNLNIVLSLTGGLGNQLFQLAAGLYLSKCNLLTVSTRYGRPRRNNEGQVEIFSFHLPSQVVIDKPGKSNRFISKVAGYLLRVGVVPRKFENFSFFARLLRILGFIAFSIERRQIIDVFYSKDIGYSDLRIKSTRTLLFGYFQTFSWVSEPLVKQSMMSLHTRNGSEIVDKFKRLAEIEKPLVVHVRLGDYLAEKNFGVPSKNYYEQGIDYILSIGKCSKVWLFSDNIEMAQNYVVGNQNGHVRTFSPSDFSTSVTFDIMRLGFGYVIANSSFSWWAAYLCENSNVEVVAPDPWFVNIPEPKKLMPTNWKRLKSSS